MDSTDKLTSIPSTVMKSPVRDEYKNNDGGSLKAAKQFEALMLQEVLKMSRTQGFESNLLSNDGMKVFNSMMDKKLSEVMADRGVGLGEFISSAINKNKGR